MDILRSVKKYKLKKKLIYDIILPRNIRVYYKPEKKRGPDALFQLL